MATLQCAQCGADDSQLEAYLRVDATMAVHCKQCDKSFGADRLRGCPKCEGHRIRMVLGGAAGASRCEACQHEFEVGALGDCPLCGGAALQFITKVEQVVVDCRACGRTGDREAMMRRVEGPATSAEGAGSCFLATAACGGPDAPAVEELRAFRERVLRPRAVGRSAIALYEMLSPPLAAVVEQSGLLRGVTRSLVVRPALALARAVNRRRA